MMRGSRCQARILHMGIPSSTRSLSSGPSIPRNKISSAESNLKNRKEVAS